MRRGREGERILPIHHKMATFFSALVKATSHSASNLKRLYSKRYTKDRWCSHIWYSI